MALRINRLRRAAREASAAIDRGVFRAAMHVKTLAVQLAPEDTGALKGSGRIEPESPDGSARYRVVFGGGDVDYARYVEYGTDNPNYPVQPYLTPAKKEISVKAEVLAELNRVIRGGA